MSVIEQAAKLYRESPHLWSLQADIMAHLESGYVFASPTALLLGRPVPHQADDALISDPWHSFDPAECDAWYVWLAVGDLREIVSFIPYEKKYIAFGRKGRIRWHRFHGLISTIQKVRS